MPELAAQSGGSLPPAAPLRRREKNNDPAAVEVTRVCASVRFLRVLRSNGQV